MVEDAFGEVWLARQDDLRHPQRQVASAEWDSRRKSWISVGTGKPASCHGSPTYDGHNGYDKAPAVCSRATCGGCWLDSSAG